MATVVGVVFQPGGRVYSFDPAGLELRWDEKVICQTARGREYGRVVQGNHTVPDEELTGPLKKVIRRVTEADEEQLAANKRDARRAMLLFRERSKAHGLSLKPIAADIVFDGNRIVFSYGSAERVDVRELTADLARRLDRRVELHAVGPREQSRLCGDHGLCGGKRCCTRFPSHEQPITLRMAKDQDLPMNPGRITGLCGRLRCCLAYEFPLYRSFRDRAPAIGRRVATPHGVGRVKGYEVLRDACVVEMEGKDAVEVKLSELHEVKVNDEH